MSTSVKSDPSVPQAPHACVGRRTEETQFHPLGWPGHGVADAFVIAAGKPAEAVVEVGENCLYTVRCLLGEAFGRGQMDANVLAACLILTNVALASYKAAGVQS
jgi:hypothetical protein